MKKLSKSLLLVALLAVYCLPAWSQASTQGKEFWVSSTIVCSPGGSSNKATPYIAVSAEKACTVTIQGGIGNAINITQNVADGSWSEFGNTAKTEQKNPAAGPVCVNMDASKWYPVSMSDASNVRSLADQKNMYGLHITATEDISVYVILSSLNSMDASNILPVTALGDEYYTQDYWSIVKSGFTNTVSMITILATEDGTKVDIIPNGNTYGKNNSGQLMTIDLNKGQTYYLMSEAEKRLSGTHIQARNGKKIAIFNGVPLTNLPTNIAARDCLFEQSMPIEYWGTQFIATRSMEKNGNLIGITASVNGTEIKVDGYSQGIINAGDTYYLMLQGPNNPNANTPGTSPIDLVVTADAAYIETSCPCAVYNYDTGNGYKGQGENDTDGDPSSVWVSPIQQKISKITFGTCYTQKTKNHFLNVVTETATCNNTKLTAIYGATQLDKSSLLTWTPVPGNTKYSYASAKIGEASTEQFSVFRLENPRGFIANVYGNGDDESYAYSAGSAAVEQGIKVEEIVFVDGTRSEEKFCMGKSNKIELEFDAKVGTDEVTRVDWDFGDGVSENHGTPQTKHTYYSPGWYDVTASLYGHQVCADESEILLGTVRFTFRVIRPDTLIADTVLCADEVPTFHFPKAPNNRTYTMQDESQDEIIRDTIPTGDYCDAVYILTIYAIGKRDSTVDLDQVLTKEQRRDSAWIPAGIDKAGEWVDESGEYDRTYLRAGTKCDSVVTYSVTVISCLNIEMSNDSLEVCNGSPIDLPFVHKKGEIQTASLKCNGKTIDIPFNTDSHGAPISPFTLPTDAIDPGKYNASIVLSDPNCDNAQEIPLHLTIYYPEDVFTYQFNNVLAVWKKGYGGNVNPGWDFVAYQWYRNDELIPGATESVYHATEPFTMYDRYYVELTRRDGHVLRSCDKLIEHVEEYTPPIEEEENGEQNGDQGNDQPANAPAKVIRNQQMLILHDGVEFNMFGQRVR